jgi:hypothetical protein
LVAFDDCGAHPVGAVAVPIVTPPAPVAVHEVMLVHVIASRFAVVPVVAADHVLPLNVAIVPALPPAAQNELVGQLTDRSVAVVGDAAMAHVVPLSTTIVPACPTATHDVVEAQLIP